MPTTKDPWNGCAQLYPLGDRAILARLPDLSAARAWADAVRCRTGANSGPLSAVTDVVLAYATVGVYWDVPEDNRQPHPLHQMATSEQIWKFLESVRVEFRHENLLRHEQADRVVTVPVLYDGPDLDDVGRRLHRSAAEIVALHSGTEYRVQAMGFLPGFPYAGPLPEALAGLPRREVPRERVAAGSVAVTGRQTGVYPQESPGGWHLLGRTPVILADPARGFFPLRAGDRLVFVPIDRETFTQLEGTDLA